MNILKKRKWDEAPDSDSNHQRKQEKQKSTHVCIHKIIFPSWSSFRNIMYSADILDTVFSLRDYWVNNSNLSEHKCCSCGNSTLYLKCQVLQRNVMCKYERWYGFMSCDIFFFKWLFCSTTAVKSRERSFFCRCKRFLSAKRTCFRPWEKLLTMPTLRM